MRRTVLVFSKTSGYRHDSIPAGIAMMRRLGRADGFAVEATEDAAALDDLSGYAAVVFLSTSGDVLDDAQRTELERYVRTGGGFVGVHSAAATEDDWPFYETLIGARFAGHPEIQALTVHVTDHDHPATAGLPDRWRWTDEAYDYRTVPPIGTRVLCSLDESEYVGGTMGGDHPIAWCHRVGAGRAFHTGLGHAIEAYADERFQAHVGGGIAYACR
jgi:type 1 glutamine amidotransferase